MCRVVLALFMITGLSFVLATPSIGFDGNRRGFLLGVGAGPSVSSYRFETFENGFLRSNRRSTAGIASDLRIGFGATERLLVYYDNQVSWFRFDSPVGHEVTIADGVTTAAVSYYMRRNAPSAYVTTGVGLAGWSAPFEDGSGNSGFGYFAGYGHELNRLLSIVGTVSYAKVSAKALDVRVMLNVLGY